VWYYKIVIKKFGGNYIMKHALKTGAVVFLTLAMLVGFVACNRNPEQSGDVPPGYKPNVVGEITFTIQVNNEEEKLSPDAFIRAFEKMYPDAKVNRDYNVGQIEARIASGDIGDVFHFPEEHTYTYAVTHRALMPLDAYLEPLGINVSQVYSGIYDLGVVNGRLYMASRDHNHIVLMANLDALHAAGLDLPQNDWTWEEFKVNYAPNLVKTNDDGTFDQVPMNISLSYDPIYIPFMEGWGGKWFDTINKRVNLVSDPKVLQGIEEMINAAEDGFLYPTGKQDVSDYAGLRQSDYVFRQMVYPGMYTLAVEYDRLGVNWDIATFPMFPIPKVGTGSSGFGVYNRTKRPDTAAAFALFFFTEEGQKAYNGQTGGSVPLMRTLANDDFWRGKGTEWEGKNYDAYVAFPENDTVGQVQCRVPAPVAEMIDGNPWLNMLRQHFDGHVNFKDSLTTIETRANQKWESLVDFEE
jgi:ABC-type glycerol-3-phosphate transport system substrate-binding protein